MLRSPALFQLIDPEPTHLEIQGLIFLLPAIASHMPRPNSNGVPGTERYARLLNIHWGPVRRCGKMDFSARIRVCHFSPSVAVWSGWKSVLGRTQEKRESL
jgi:hypothetical protein